MVTQSRVKRRLADLEKKLLPEKELKVVCCTLGDGMTKELFYDEHEGEDIDLVIFGRYVSADDELID